MQNVIRLSLRDLLGDAYIDAVSLCAEELLELETDQVRKLTDTEVEFFSAAAEKKSTSLLSKVGEAAFKPMETRAEGAPTESFKKASNLNASPVGGLAWLRVGEDGRLYLTAKSEHYHTPLGHNFGGYRLITYARELGILNATHNNTRGYIVRKMESELIRCVNDLNRSQQQELEAVIKSKKPKVLNRVINLETGSLAVEAGIKMMLTRFYRLDKTYAEPIYAGRIPVFFIMADNLDGKEANYHGTTVIAQTLRGMWPEFYEALEEHGLYRVVAVRKNDLQDFKEKMEKYNTSPYKTAGFLHEIILMNYGGIRLTEEYLNPAYELCAQYDTPTLVDEIQSCMWYPGMFLYKLYGLKPDFVILGKGFPGGEYPASKIITTYEMDSLSQFGALVTNGQEELASLAYLITMEYAQASSVQIQTTGDAFEGMLCRLKERYSEQICRIEGRGHLAAVHFNTVEDAAAFAGRLNDQGIDISAQTYKADCPPAALLKLPIIVNQQVIDFLELKMLEALKAQEKGM